MPPCIHCHNDHPHAVETCPHRALPPVLGAPLSERELLDVMAALDASWIDDALYGDHLPAEGA